MENQKDLKNGSCSIKDSKESCGNKCETKCKDNCSCSKCSVK